MNNTIENIISTVFDNDFVRLTPVQWAEKKRILTKAMSVYADGKPMSYRKTPYLIKMANSFMPNRLAQIIAIMKGSQLGISIAVIFTILGWIMDESQANTLFITENDEKLKDQMQGPIDQMISCSGLIDKVGTHNIRERQATNRRRKGTGDTVKGIDFGGGKLYTLSGQTVASLSSWAIKYGIYDEVERWKGIYKTSGDFMGLVEPRHRSFGDRRKLLFASTPEIKQTSNIEPIYLLGDQQKYMIPCKHCGEMIEFIWYKNINDNNAGIHYERQSNGKYIDGSAIYICQKCGNNFKEIHKFEMYEETYTTYKNGSNLVCDWHPTAIPENPIYESYHIPTLYSPEGFYSWQDMARNWCMIHPPGRPVKTHKLQVFYNQELGLTWEIPGSEIEIKHLMKNTRNYDIGVVPDALSKQDGNGPIVMITSTADLNGKEDDARLDYEVLAWSKSGSSYSINHGSIGTFQRSKTVRSGQAKKYASEDDDRVKWTYRHNYPNNVWSVYEKEVMSKIFPSDDGKRKFRIAFHGIDTGHFTHHAYEFVNKHGNVIGLKGKVDNKYTKHDADKSFFKKSTTQDKLYLVEGDRIKNDLHGEIQLVWSEDMDIDQPEGFMNFPNPDGEKYMIKSYFSHFEGEKMEVEMNLSGTAIGFRWVKRHSSSVNHLFDCRVYNIALKHVFTSMVCKDAKVPVSWVNFMVLFGK